jgi:hypothetical protein
MLPHERSLVARMEGRPFALLGVNCDSERQTLQQISFYEHLNWPNWWNGGTRGQFTALYGIDHYPTTFVLDANGIIRYREVPGPELDQAVETLLREMEQQRRS